MGLRNWFGQKLEKRPAEAIEFIHRQPPRPNLGDHLCSPKHYYDFVAEPSAGTVAVIGGGAYTDFAVGVARTSKHDHRILWGVGRSLSTHNPPLDLAAIDRLFDFCSTRDPEWALNGIKLVPCASVFHPICDVMPGARTGLFLNASPTTSGERIDDLLRERAARQADLVVATNAMPEPAFVRAFTETSCLVTNSYHVAYWGLLSGRAVTVIGYSSKFSSVLRLFEQDPNSVIQYRKGDSDALAAAIDQALSEPPRARLANPGPTKSAFREINDRFAADLVRIGLFQSITPRTPVVEPTRVKQPARVSFKTWPTGATGRRLRKLIKRKLSLVMIAA